jgi:hypothetical protein
MVLEQIKHYCVGAQVRIYLLVSDLTVTGRDFSCSIFSPSAETNDNKEKWAFKWRDTGHTKWDKEIYCEVHELEGLIEEELGNLPYMRYEAVDLTVSMTGRDHYSMSHMKMWESMECKGKLWKEKALRFIQLIAMGGFWSAVDI